MIVHLFKHKKSFNTYLCILLRYFFLFYFLFGFTQNNYSQTYPFRHYTIEDGLPNSQVYHAIQDSRGYIWFATDDGVSRFDGYEFKNFTKKDGLTDNTVFEIYEDHKNRIWFVPHSLNLSYFQNDTIIKYEFNDSIQSRLNGYVNPVKLSFFVDSTNTIFFRDRRTGSYTIDTLGNIKQRILKAYGKCFEIKGNRIIRFNSATDKLEGIYIISIFSNKKEIFNANLTTSISKNNVLHSRHYGVINKKNIYLSHGKYIFHIKGSSLQTIKTLDNNIIWVSVDNNNNLWVGTYEGAYCFHNSDLKITPEIYLKDKSVSSVLNDSEGGYWFTTLYNGVYYLSNINVKTYTEEHGLLRNDVRSLAYDSTSLWMGFKNNYIQSFKSGKFKNKVKLDELNIVNYNLFYDNFNDKLWIGAQTLSVYHNSNITYFINKNSSSFHRVFHANDFLRDKNNNIWIASFYGLYKYQYHNKPNLNRLGIFNRKINSICLNSLNNILIGCNNGLWEYKIDSNKAYSLATEHELFNSKITNIIFNNYHNNNWLGSRTNGIIVYDTDTIFNITSDNGLSNNNITSLLAKNEVIWVTTQNGLNKITLLSKPIKDSIKIETFSTIHGLPSNELNDIYIKNSIAYVASKKGLTVFNTKKLKPNYSNPPVFINKVNILGKDTIVKNYYKLPHNKNSIFIGFVGLMYRSSENKKYKYQLSQPGKQAKWAETTDNHINFSSLSPGKYTFKVIAINEDGYESNVPATLSFTINPPYWKTWWFISSIVFISILIMYILYRARIYELNKRNAIEKRLMQEVNKFRQQSLSQQMNPHFIFNTLNSIQYYIYENDNVSSTRYLAKFSKLIRLILDNSRQETVTIKNEIKAIELYLQLEAVRLKHKFKYKINIHEDIDTNLYRIYPLLIQPYVENSIWHGLVHKKGEKYVSIDIKPMNGYILCIIEDNGIGREKALEIKRQRNQKHKSHGTNITHKRIESINKLFGKDFDVEFTDLKDDKGNAAGTKVVLQIPKIIS